MMPTFYDMVEHTTKVFMDEFCVVGDSFDWCFSNFHEVFKRCEGCKLALNLIKCHFMVKKASC